MSSEFTFSEGLIMTKAISLPGEGVDYFEDFEGEVIKNLKDPKKDDLYPSLLDIFKRGVVNVLAHDIYVDFHLEKEDRVVRVEMDLPEEEHYWEVEQFVQAACLVRGVPFQGSEF